MESQSDGQLMQKLCEAFKEVGIIENTGVTSMNSINNIVNLNRIQH